MKSPSCGEVISNHEYHHGRDWGHLVSSTQFKRIYESPAAFKWPLPFTEGPATDLGTATHSAVLEPDKMSELIVLPDLPCRSNADKDDWRRWLDNFGANQAEIEAARLKDDFVNLARTTANRCGKSIVSMSQLETTKAMSVSVLECQHAVEALTGGSCELSFRAYGRKARPDCMSGGLLSDLKTCARFDHFGYQARDLKYPSSLAWYDHVLSDCGVNVFSWAWIVVESAPYRLASDGIARHRVKIVVASEELKMQAQEELEDAITTYKSCVASGEWPSKEIPVEELQPTRY